jgi:hypothetical protein
MSCSFLVSLPEIPPLQFSYRETMGEDSEEAGVEENKKGRLLHISQDFATQGRGRAEFI